MQIPKKVHYCWFGKNPLPAMAVKCIESWKKYLPDYEIIEWNEDNFDVNIIPYTQEAYEAKKYAFVSDFARFWILYRHGGLYFDTDVEVIKPMDKILSQGAFMGCEQDYDSPNGVTVAPGLGLAAPIGMPIYKELENFYGKLHFLNADGTLNQVTIVEYTTNCLKKHGLCDIEGFQMVADLRIYPSRYFCPISVVDGKLRITSDTYSIHHYAQSWQSPARKYGRKLALLLGGEKFKNVLKKLLYS